MHATTGPIFAASSSEGEQFAVLLTDKSTKATQVFVNPSVARPFLELVNCIARACRRSLVLRRSFPGCRDHVARSTQGIERSVRDIQIGGLVSSVLRPAAWKESAWPFSHLGRQRRLAAPSKIIVGE